MKEASVLGVGDDFCRLSNYIHLILFNHYQIKNLMEISYSNNMLQFFYYQVFTYFTVFVRSPLKSN